MGLPIQKIALIETQRLTIKPYAMEDMDGLVNLLINPKITKTFMVPQFESREQMESLAKKLIVFSREEVTKHLEYGFYLDGKLIGFINDCGIEDEEIEIGYLIYENAVFRHRGRRKDPGGSLSNTIKRTQDQEALSSNPVSFACCRLCCFAVSG